MMVYTGEFKISFYNKYGGRLKGLDAKATSLMEAQGVGETVLALEGEAVSFAVDRRIYNSIDSGAQRWLPELTS